MARPIYLDHAATTPVDDRVISAMMPYFHETWGNPSSVYGHGRSAKRALDESRDTVAGVLGSRPNEIVFTSGGTESDNLAIKGVALARRAEGRRIVTTSIEHHAVLHTCEWLAKYHDFEIAYVDVDEYGVIDIAQYERLVTSDTMLVSVMLANNEIGTVQPIRSLARIARQRGAIFHTDAVQAGGSLAIDVDELGVDLLSLSAHKLYGPKGVGLLYVRRGTPLIPQIQGGGQERGVRSGTENVPYIVGMARAMRLAREELESRDEHARRQRDRLVQGVTDTISGVRLTGHPTSRLANNASFVFSETDGESILMNLDQFGICASSGSACSSGSLEVSHVLKAIGLTTELARGSVRFSTGMASTDSDIDAVLGVLPPAIERVRSIMPTLAAVRE